MWRPTFRRCGLDDQLRRRRNGRDQNVGNLRTGTDVFNYEHACRTTDRRAFFKLNQSEVVRFNLANLELLAQEMASRDSPSSTPLEKAGVRAAL